MTDAYIVGIFTIVGTALGAWVSYAVAARNARIEEKKHFRELGLKVALTKFEACMKMGQQLADATRQFQEVPPFEAFVVHGIKFMDIVSTPGLSAHETARRMTELKDFTQTIIHAAKKQTPDA